MTISLASLALIPVKAFAQTPGNNPWSWCNYHPYSQPVDPQCQEEEEEWEEAQTAPGYQPSSYALPAPTYMPPYPTSIPTQVPVPTTVPSLPQAQLRYLLEQHSALSANVLMAHIDQRSDYQAKLQALNQNTQQLGSLIGSSYGSQAQSDFLNLWQSHIDALAAYSDAVKANDMNAKNQAFQNLLTFDKNIAAFFNSYQPNQQNLQNMFQQHIQDETVIVDNYVAGNRQLIPGFMNESAQHADMIADALAFPAGSPTPYPSPTGQ